MQDSSACYAENIKNIRTALSRTEPSEVLITGGEPMLYPDLVAQTIKAVHLADKPARVTLCTNMLFDMNKARHILSSIDAIQTSYSVDRETIVPNITSRIRSGIRQARRYHNIKDISIVWSITPAQLKVKPESACHTVESLEADAVMMETLSWTKKTDSGYETYLKNADHYIKECFKLLPEQINGTLHAWQRAERESFDGLVCHDCEEAQTYTLRNGTLEKQCNCLYETIDRSRLFVEHCAQCPLYRKCKMSCMRYGAYCGFPKETYQYVIMKKGGICNGRETRPNS